MTRKIALITGANRGIGLETARDLGERGIAVILGSRDRDKGQGAAKELKRSGIEAKVMVCIQVIGEDDAVAFAGIIINSPSTRPAYSATPATSCSASRWRGRGSSTSASTGCSAARSCW